MTNDELAAAAGERLIRSCEGCRLAPYQDTAGVWTIGIGSILLADGSAVKANTPPITLDMADGLLLGELRDKIARVNAVVRQPVTIGQLAAFYSFTYDEGVTAFSTSTLLRLFNNGNVAGASAQFPRWNMSGGRITPGLVNRRKIERACFDGLVQP